MLYTERSDTFVFLLWLKGNYKQAFSQTENSPEVWRKQLISLHPWSVPETGNEKSGTATQPVSLSRSRIDNLRTFIAICTAIEVAYDQVLKFIFLLTIVYVCGFIHANFGFSTNAIETMDFSGIKVADVLIQGIIFLHYKFQLIGSVVSNLKLRNSHSLEQKHYKLRLCITGQRQNFVRLKHVCCFNFDTGNKLCSTIWWIQGKVWPEFLGCNRSKTKRAELMDTIANVRSSSCYH